MLRPERMSRVSVTGTKRVMNDVIEAVHDMNRVHLTEYDGSWVGFEPGDPIGGAEETSEKLVTIRSLENILDLDPEDAGPTAAAPTDDELGERLEEIRTEVNELDDRRSELREELRGIEERIDAIEPFVDLGIDLDLLSGYDSLSVVVGEAERAAVETVLEDLDCAVGTFAGEDLVAVFARTDEAELEDALVGTEFRSVDVPEGEGPPGSFVEELEHERERIERKLERVETDIEELKLDAGGFLLAAEERLSIEVQKAEAPLTFATTKNAFVAEGWVPTSEYDDLVSALEAAVGDAVEVEELERADYEDGHAEEQEVVADGGTALGSTDPPVVQDNPGIAQPFEAFVGAVGVPNYDELDPTVILFLTFPLFFGFMIGDIGYGLIYIGIGYWMMRTFESDGLRSMGSVGVWCGGFTVLFGVFYGELFGLHFISDTIWSGSSPIHKGLQPKYLDWALMWLAFAVFAGIAHLVIGWTYDFVNTLGGHGLKDAVLESGSWILMAFGLWSWVFSAHLEGTKPGFLFETPYWAGALVPADVGMAGLGVFFVGGLMVTYAEGIVGFLEAFLEVTAFGAILSYTRITAVLVAKAGMALGVNLLVFGAYQDSAGAFHYIFMEGGSTHGYEAIFGGLLTGGPLAILLGLFVFVLGHAIVLALGVTSAGLQAVRLEYVEFFGEFYEGGGEEYEPFGYERAYTAE
jgi:V/A-type H+-transporting ATPase subunit I